MDYTIIENKLDRMEKTVFSKGYEIELKNGIPKRNAVNDFVWMVRMILEGSQ